MTSPVARLAALKLMAMMSSLRSSHSWQHLDAGPCQLQLASHICVIVTYCTANSRPRAISLPYALLIVAPQISATYKSVSGGHPVSELALNSYGYQALTSIKGHDAQLSN